MNQENPALPTGFTWRGDSFSLPSVVLDRANASDRDMNQPEEGAPSTTEKEPTQ